LGSKGRQKIGQPIILPTLRKHQAVSAWQTFCWKCCF